MDNSKYYYFDDDQKLCFTDDFWKLSDDKGQAVLVEACEKWNKLRALGCKNVRSSDVLMSRNLDRALVKKTVCLRVPQDLVHSYQSFAGRLNVPVADLFNYVLKYGFLSLREIKEI